MDEKTQAELRERFMAAVDSFVGKIRGDPGVIAVIVSGSLAYDVLWERSDIDLSVIVRDQMIKTHSYCIVEDGITINCDIIQRSSFKRWMEQNIGGSFSLSYFSKGRIVYTTDDSLYEYFEDIKRIGADDIALNMFYNAGELIYTAEKCRKWLTVREDPLYAQYFLLKAAEKIADMVLCLNGEPTSRQSIQKAIAIDPECISPFYGDAMSHHMSEEEIKDGIERIDRFLTEHIDKISKPVLEYMADQEIRTITMISNYFKCEAHYIIGVFDWLAEKGVIEKVSQTIRITPKGRQNIEEIGYLYIQ
jgi:hypothetical protein